MKESRSSIYSLLTGLAGGALAWCGTEWLLYMAPHFPDFRIFSALLGGISGLLLGAVAPTAEGLRQSQKQKIVASVVVGACIGALAGAGGMLLGQLLMALIADSMTGGALTGWSGALARIPGWTIMGMAVGSASGIRSRSGRRIVAGLFGGLIGGLIGGAASEALSVLVGGYFGRAVGMILWGGSVAYLADLMEARRARGRLTVLSGPLKGRSFPVNQHHMTIASDRKADLTIPGTGEAEAASGVTQVNLKKGTVVLEAPAGEKVEVNGEQADKTELRYDDIIKVGGVTVIYEAGR